MGQAPVPSIVSPHFLTLCDLHYPDFARSKLSYRGRMSRKLCKTLSFPLLKKIRSSHLCSSSLTLDYNPSSGPQFLRFEPTGSPLCWLRIKATFLFPPNSVFVFFIQLRRAKKAKILARHNLLLSRFVHSKDTVYT